MAENLGNLIVKLTADTSDLKKNVHQARTELEGFKNAAEKIGSTVRNALAITVGSLGLYGLGNALQSVFRKGIEAVDSFKLRTIGVAATLTDLADTSDFSQAYAQNLGYAVSMYKELELAAAKYFASGEEMTQAWNILAQKGIVLRHEEIDSLGIIVDRIKLSTQGQVSGLQIAQELRAVLNGQVRATDQVALLLKDRIPNLQEEINKHKEIGDLVTWLGEQFKGLNLASKDITQTLEAQGSTLGTLLTQVGRAGLAGAYKDIVDWVSQINDYLAKHGDELAGKIAFTWNVIKEIAQGVLIVFQAMGTALAKGWSYLEGWRTSLTAIAKQRKDMGVGLGLDLAPGLEMGGAAKAETKHFESFEGYETAGEGLRERYGGTIPSKLKPTKTEIEDGSKAGKQQMVDLLKYLTEYMEAKRKLELKDAEESVKILKAEQDRKRAELELWRHEGQISHQEYYQSLKILAEDETKATLNLIDTKIAKEKEAYDWARKAVAEKSGKGEISPEAQELALKKLLVEHTTRLKEMDVEALTAKINLQKTLLGVLKEELGNRERIQDMLASGAEAAALGPIAEKEAQINNLLRERAKLRQGLSGEDLAQFDRLTGPLVLKERYGNEIRELGASFRGMFEEVVDGIFAGGKSLEQAFDRMWRNLLNIAIRPAMNAIEQIIINFFTNLFKNIGGGGGGGWLKGWAGGGQTPAPFDWSAQPFQHGGLVTRPLLGLVGEAGPEAIIPLDKMGQYGGVNLTLNVINNTRTPVEASVQRSEDSMDLVLDEAMATTFNRQGKFARTLVSGLTTNFRLTKR